MNPHFEETVFIIDDDEAVRDSTEMLVMSVGLKAKTFKSALEFLEHYSEQLFGCLILDVRMPKMDGLELQDELNSRNSTLPIIFISGHGDIPMAVKAIRKGAADFIAKPFRDQELLDSLQKALRENEKAFIKHNSEQETYAKLATLSAREKQVLTQMIDGHANKVIAADLNISQRTVEVHRAHVMDKMRMKSLAQLVKAISILES